jgi:hypothetical protein
MITGRQFLGHWHTAVPESKQQTTYKFANAGGSRNANFSTPARMRT